MVELQANTDALFEHAAVLDQMADYFAALPDGVRQHGQAVWQAIEAPGYYPADAQDYQSWLQSPRMDEFLQHAAYLHQRAQDFRDLAQRLLLTEQQLTGGTPPPIHRGNGNERAS